MKSSASPGMERCQQGGELPAWRGTGSDLERPQRLPADAKSRWISAMNSAPENSPVFTTTHWSMVIEASQGESRQADEALEKLCRAYWYPIYIFLRRSGWNGHDAEDLTQAFFERVLEKDYLQAVDRTKGRFRS